MKKIDVTEQLRLSRNGVLADAQLFQKKIAHRLTKLSPEAIVSLAMLRNPDQSADLAFQVLTVEVSEFLTALEASDAALLAALRAEKDGLAPVVAAAASRELEIVGLVAGIDSRVASNQSHDQAARERLVKAGLSGSKLESAAAPTDNGELLAEREALLAEGETLQQFLQFRNPSFLLNGFAESFSAAA